MIKSITTDRFRIIFAGQEGRVTITDRQTKMPPFDLTLDEWWELYYIIKMRPAYPTRAQYMDDEYSDLSHTYSVHADPGS